MQTGDTIDIDTADASKPLFGFTFYRQRLDDLAAACARTPTPGQGVRLVVTANTDHIVLMRQHVGLRGAYQNSWRRTIDGMPVWLYGKLVGAEVGDRITGADLFPKTLSLLDPANHRPFFVAATADIAQRLLEWTTNAGFPAGAGESRVPPFGFETDATYGAELAASIRMHRTTHLFFGVGCPRSEIWIDEHREKMGDMYAMAVGAALGFFVGSTRRAPPFFSRIGLEWSFRMLQEPRRLGPRYLWRGWHFLNIALGDLRKRAR